jgi:diguanylate cyclase (GGDEF)-like protein
VTTTQESSTEERPRPRFRAYLNGITAAGAITLVATVWQAGWRDLVGVHTAGFLLLAGLLVCSETRPMTFLRRHEGTDITISWTFAFALLLLAPPGALVAMAVASMLGDALRRTSFASLAFNAAQLVVSLAAGMLVLALPYGDGLTRSNDLSAPWLVVVLSAAAVVFLVNIVLTSVALSLHEGIGVAPLVRKGIAANSSTDGMLLAIAPVFAVTATRSLILVPLLVVAVWSVYRAANLAIARQHDATHDALTDLPNRRAFFEHVDAAHAHARRNNHCFAIALLDLNGFKQINDQLGHQVGDIVLREVAARLRRARRSTDFAARLGGDEFAVLFDHVPDEETARAAVARFREELEAPFVVSGFPVDIAGSFGLAVYPHDGHDVEVMLQHADESMYDAKQAQQPSTRTTTPHGRHRRLALLGELERAIDRHELYLHYQPKVDVRTGDVVGVEALVRWAHPQHGLVMPGDFMPLAEQTDLMAPFTTLVLDEALAQCAAWHHDGLPLAIAVNVSARNLQDDAFPAVVDELLAVRGVDPKWLELEVTENALLVDRLHAASALRDLRALGVSFAIDDFGTGYSSLANLRDLPIDRIKIDRSFVSEMGARDADALIVASTIELAEKLGVTAVAEGVEDSQVWRQLTELGCRFAQGYWIARPRPGHEIVPWIRRAHANPPPTLRQNPTSRVS